MRHILTVLAVGGALALAIASPGLVHADFVPLPSPTPGTPGVALDPFTSSPAGTVLATLEIPFVDNAAPTPFATGTLHSLVVDRGGGLLDFYYQLANTSPPPSEDTKEFFRFKTTGGFDPGLDISVAQTDTLGNLVAGSSDFNESDYPTTGQAVATADRDVETPGSIGFTFPTQPPLAFIGDPANVGQGEASEFLIVRTNATRYQIVEVAISGAATSLATALAPGVVPEPSTLAMGGALLFTAAVRRRRASDRRR